MSARHVLRDARLERGETPAEGTEELVEAMRLTHDPDATVAALAEQATDEATPREQVAALWLSFTGRMPH